MTEPEPIEFSISVAAAGLAQSHSGTYSEWYALLLAGRTLGFPPDQVMRIVRTSGATSPAAVANLLAVAHDGRTTEGRYLPTPEFRLKVRSYPGRFKGSPDVPVCESCNWPRKMHLSGDRCPPGRTKEET